MICQAQFFYSPYSYDAERRGERLRARERLVEPRMRCHVVSCLSQIQVQVWEERQRWGRWKQKEETEETYPVSSFLYTGSFEVPGLYAAWLGTHLHGTEEVKKPEEKNFPLFLL